MAARIKLHHQEDVKQKIRASQLVNFLQKHALDGSDANPSRIDAAKFLLNKIIGNPPQALEHSGPNGGSFPVKVEIVGVEPSGQ